MGHVNGMKTFVEWNLIKKTCFLIRIHQSNPIASRFGADTITQVQNRPDSDSHRDYQILGVYEIAEKLGEEGTIVPKRYHIKRQRDDDIHVSNTIYEDKKSAKRLGATHTVRGMRVYSVEIINIALDAVPLWKLDQALQALMQECYKEEEGSNKQRIDHLPSGGIFLPRPFAVQIIEPANKQNRHKQSSDAGDLKGKSEGSDRYKRRLRVLYLKPNSAVRLKLFFKTVTWSPLRSP
ncbi:hypothetical protein PROFUN_14600 [Planoprotostelium fungivorum]|uniref:Uncharacterized protein n=1 Tax=Planoprotostelium fungivorum TaxID=1890364 RepID=A0A2P6MZF2_9EUKA|nr:hypothetical protein PROFUN_14600 [Planoprotostelium fungivorum]